mmetsp:Transcript_151187/g.485684  ORF Transcript_151187/g.485684 Transcript_151187/m.485684 type:complete len:250 (+) Transcript_151187:520-1269(+)
MGLKRSKPLVSDECRSSSQRACISIRRSAPPPFVRRPSNRSATSAASRSTSARQAAGGASPPEARRTAASTETASTFFAGKPCTQEAAMRAASRTTPRSSSASAPEHSPARVTTTSTGDPGCSFTTFSKPRNSASNRPWTSMHQITTSAAAGVANAASSSAAAAPPPAARAEPSGRRVPMRPAAMLPLNAGPEGGALLDVLGVSRSASTEASCAMAEHSKMRRPARSNGCGKVSTSASEHEAAIPPSPS